MSVIDAEEQLSGQKNGWKVGKVGMIIERHGKVYLFKCRKCGCRFRATLDELLPGKEDGDMTDYCKCPDCGNTVEGHLITDFECSCEPSELNNSADGFCDDGERK